MQSITISIVIPNYNHAHHLTKAVNCAVNQKESADEILIIDDGSTDNSLEVIRELQQRYPQVKLLQNPSNLGVLYTINRALVETSSSHVIIAAADDWLEPELIFTAKQQLKLHPTVGLWSSGSWIAYENNPLKQIPARMLYPYPTEEHSYLSPKQVADKLLALDSWFMGNTAVLNRKFALEEEGYRAELESFTDNFLYRVLAAKHGCCFSAKRLGTWQICNNSYSSTFSVKTEKQIEVLKQVISLMRKKYCDLFDEKLITRTDLRIRFNLARTIWRQQNGIVTPALIQLLDREACNLKLKSIVILLLKLSNKIPKFGMYIGEVILFVAIRPFDLANQFKIMCS